MWKYYIGFYLSLGLPNTNHESEPLTVAQIKNLPGMILCIPIAGVMQHP
jgi:hypothetical protein